MPMFRRCGSGVILGIYLGPSVFIRCFETLPKAKSAVCIAAAPQGRQSSALLDIGEGPRPAVGHRVQVVRDDLRPGPTDPLPAIVSERLVRFSHPVRVLLLLHGAPFPAARREQFAREPL